MLLLTIGLTICSDNKRYDCTIPLPTTFYHWQTHLAPDATARHLLDSFASERLYVKAFDVSWADGQLATTAWLKADDTSGLPPLSPVVFLTNEVFRQLPEERMPGLAEDILRLTDKLLPTDYSELQLDCDWTARTRDTYFALLQALRVSRPELTLTCTVRLHQYRDRSAQGVPPVPRATLMAYNTGNLDDWETDNSILDTNVVKSYLAGQPAYPLPLDLAVAVYDWAAVYRRDELAYLINEPDLAELEDTTRFTRLNDLRYVVRTSTYLDGTYLYRGDLLRREVASPASLEEQTVLLRRYVNGFPGQRLVIYRLGSRLWR